MVQEFQVQNFYSIRERQTLSFVPTNADEMRSQYVHKVADGVELLKLGIIYGSNASGKTTILNALVFFRHFMLEKPTSKSEGIAYWPYMLDNHSKDEHSVMQMTFWINGEKYILSVEFDRQRIYDEQLIMYASVRPTTLYKRTYNAETDYSTIKYSTKLGLSKLGQVTISGNTLNNCTVMAAFSQSNVESSKLNTIFDYFWHHMPEMLSPHHNMLQYVRDTLRNAKNNDVKDFVVKVMKAADFNIVDLHLEQGEEPITPEIERVIKNARIPDSEKSDMLKRGTLKHEDLILLHHGEDGDYELIEDEESQGTKRFIGMSVLLYHLFNRNCFIMIDEVESSLHYELLSYFIKLFLANSERTSQLLITTHDINLLDEDFIRRDIIWFTQKSDANATLMKRLSSMGLHKTLSPYNAYRQGKLGGWPFTGSIYLNND